MGQHAGMDYLSTERSIVRRSDPRQILPECRSILVLGLRYSAPKESFDKQETNPRGRIASYAHGRDYHLVMPEMMEKVMQDVQIHLGKKIPYLCYTDTGPILERDLAQRAGLGWIGKNSCLIHPEHGSYFLLGEILMGIDLDCDLPFTPDRCGNCKRCMEACPTGCIQPDRTFDARRCISYLTIEHKGTIPGELCSAIGDHIFGCDICQRVCPWNGKAEKQAEIIENEFYFQPAPKLLEELELDRQGFNQKFKNTALMRTRRSRYLRNILIALSNQEKTVTNFELIRQFKNDDDDLLSEQARIVLERWT